MRQIVPPYGEAPYAAGAERFAQAQKFEGLYDEADPAQRFKAAAGEKEGLWHSALPGQNRRQKDRVLLQIGGNAGALEADPELIGGQSGRAARLQPRKPVHHPIGDKAKRRRIIRASIQIIGEKLNEILFGQRQIDLGIVEQMCEAAPGPWRELQPVRPFIARLMADIEARRLAQRMEELPFREKAAQQEQPGMHDLTAVQNKSPDQKKKISKNEREVQ